MRVLTAQRVLHHWERLHTSYWFIPAVMLVITSILATMLLAVDRKYFSSPDDDMWLYTGSVEGARVLLSAVAGSIITVAGVVFSITMSTLTQASNQFGPRLLRNFMRDIGNQIVLGTFVSTFVYCILVLRSVEGTTQADVPHLSITGALLLSVASICLLIYFIHHVSFGIQAPQVVANVWAELHQSIQRMFPYDLGQDGPHLEDPLSAMPTGFSTDAIVIETPVAGYLQAVDCPELMRFLEERDLWAELLARPGDFLVFASPLLRVWPPERVNDEVVGSLQQLFIQGRYRTAEQDIEFAIDQLAEVAVRALSDAINDPYTAMNCIDWLGDILDSIAGGNTHSECRLDSAGTVRVVATVTTFAGAVDAAINHIRQSGRKSPAITIRLLEMIAAVAPRLKHEKYRAPLRRQATIIHRESRRANHAEEDLKDIDNRFRVVMQYLNQGTA